MSARGQRLSLRSRGHSKQGSRVDPRSRLPTQSDRPEPPSWPDWDGALVLPELGVPYFSELSGAIIEEVAKRSYVAVIEQTDGDPVRERALLDEDDRGRLFDGFIFSPLGLGGNELAGAVGTP